MPNYILITRTTNTYEQESIDTIKGKAETPEDFLELCFQLCERENKNTGLTIDTEEPDDFGFAGGFCSFKKDWDFYDEDGKDYKDILMKFPW